MKTTKELFKTILFLIFTIQIGFAQSVILTPDEGVKANKLHDSDNTTRIEVEKTPNDHKIRFYLQGEQLGKLDSINLDLEFGNKNVFIGKNSGINTHDFFGQKNVGIGIDALKLNVSGSRNTAIGYKTLEMSSYGLADDNTAVGYGSLSHNIRGDENSALGSFALYNNLTGRQNTSSGARSLYSNESGSYNSSFGYRSLYSNDGSFNSAFGSYSLNNVVNGHYNLALGSWAGGYIKSGDYNVIVGAYAGTSDTSSYKNVYIGYHAGYGGYGQFDNLTNREGSIFIGFRSGRDELRSNRLYIENSSSGTPLIYGNFEDDSIKIHGSLSVKDEYTFPVLDGTNGQHIETDGSGNLVWVNSDGPKTLIQDADTDTKIETEASSDEDIIRIQANGSEVLLIKEDSLKVDGNLEVTDNLKTSGYTQLGEESPAIKLKTITGTSSATQGTSVSIAHGLSPSKIINVSVYVNNSVQNWIPPNYDGGPNYEYDYFFNHTSVVIKNMAGNSSNMLSKPLKILITYME